jgi:hypothetical protein
MSQNFKILFFLKKGRNRNEKSLPIYVRVTTNGERVEWTCQRNCHQVKWNQQTGRAIGNKDETKSLNQYLDAILANIFQVQKEGMNPLLLHRFGQRFFMRRKRKNIR